MLTAMPRSSVWPRLGWVLLVPGVPARRGLFRVGRLLMRLRVSWGRGLPWAVPLVPGVVVPRGGGSLRLGWVAMAPGVVSWGRGLPWAGCVVMVSGVLMAAPRGGLFPVAWVVTVLGVSGGGGLFWVVMVPGVRMAVVPSQIRYRRR